MIVLVPAYEPDEKLVTLLGSLRAAAPDTGVLVVDDGSGPAYQPFFDAARRLGCEVIGHTPNRGKGYALKSGFGHIARAHRGEDVVCADSDGQHSVADILAVARRVRASRGPVLGARRFTGRVPLRSRLGNTVTAALFAATSGRRLRDTQTGLRGYPHGMLDWLRSVPGSRFEYEMNVLLRAGPSGYPVQESTIDTIYLDGNASSHFRPVRDSIRIYLPLLRFAASSSLAFVVDVSTLLAVHALTGALLPAAVSARAVSSAVNFVVNRRLVFTDRGGPWPAAAGRYFALVATLLAVNYGLITLLTGWGLALLAAKLATDAGLFAASYLAQRWYVFRPTAPAQGLDSRTTEFAGSMNTRPTPDEG